MYTLENRRFFKCTLKERASCMDVVETVVDLANTARKEGVLALEDRAVNMDDPFIQKGLMLIVDGTDPELVYDILRVEIVTSQREGAALLRWVMALEGLLSIQAGENPRIIEEKLKGFIGFDALESFDEELNKKPRVKVPNPLWEGKCDKIRTRNRARIREIKHLRDTVNRQSAIIFELRNKNNAIEAAQPREGDTPEIANASVSANISASANTPEATDTLSAKTFTFEDFLAFPNRDIQIILREVDQTDFSIALKSASEALKTHFFANLSKRLGEFIKENMSLMGELRPADIEEAQLKIINIARRLQDCGEIVGCPI
ncbi:MAG: hypothetical protein FWD90_03320 [Defluviitaleaceae bacterium]|nr:hypothetical protein [Defluviitaleaceae bacterium]